MFAMNRREPTPAEHNDLVAAVRNLAWRQALILSDLDPDGPPTNPFDESALDEAEQSAAVLAMLAALTDIKTTTEQLININVLLAGASGPAIGAALKTSGSAVRKRWPQAVDRQPGRRTSHAVSPDERARYRAEWFGEPIDDIEEL